MALDHVRPYHARLIAGMVTGKLDVRAAAAGLPEDIVAKIESELSEAESVDEMRSNANEHDIPPDDE